MQTYKKIRTFHPKRYYFQPKSIVGALKSIVSRLKSIVSPENMPCSEAKHCLFEGKRSYVLKEKIAGKAEAVGMPGLNKWFTQLKQMVYPA